MGSKIGSFLVWTDRRRRVSLIGEDDPERSWENRCLGVASRLINHKSR